MNQPIPPIYNYGLPSAGNPLYANYRQLQPNQDANFPFNYDYGSDTYFAFRWDFKEADNCPMCPEFTPEFLNTLNVLWLTNHPAFFSSPWMECQARLTTFALKIPSYLILHPQGRGVVFQNHVVKQGPLDPTGQYVLNYDLTPAGKHYANCGIEGFVFPDNFESHTTMALLNPSRYIVGSRSNYFQGSELKTLFAAESLVAGSDIIMNGFSNF